MHPCPFSIRKSLCTTSHLFSAQVAGSARDCGGSQASAQGSLPATQGAPAEVSQPALRARLLLLGLEIPGDLAKRSLAGALGWSGNYDEEQRVCS